VRESDIERHLVQRVKALGGEVRKVQWIGRRGAPDRLVMVPAPYTPKQLIEMFDQYPEPGHARAWLLAKYGRVGGLTFWAELKAPGVKPENHQVREHLRLRMFGFRVEVIDSIEAVERLLS
jgi:hypothetical protein